MAITVDDVAKLIDIPQGKTSADIDPFLASAGLVVTEDLAAANLSPARQDLVAQYLAAHFATVSWEYGGIQRQKYGNAEDYYKTVNSQDRGYMSTRFGQAAIGFDTSGTLAALSESKPKASFRVVKPVDRRDDGYTPLGYGDGCIPNA